MVVVSEVKVKVLAFVVNVVKTNGSGFGQCGENGGFGGFGQFGKKLQVWWLWSMWLK